MEATWVAPSATPMCPSTPKIAIGRPHHTGKPVGFGSKRSRYLNWPHLVNVLAVQNGFSQAIPALLPLPSPPTALPLQRECRVVTGPKKVELCRGLAATFARAQVPQVAPRQGRRFHWQPLAAMKLADTHR